MTPIEVTNNFFWKPALRKLLHCKINLLYKLLSLFPIVSSLYHSWNLYEKYTLFVFPYNKSGVRRKLVGMVAHIQGGSTMQVRPSEFAGVVY